MTFFKRANASYKKLFQPFQLPIDPVIQSKEIVINGETYTLIGQQTVNRSPIITNFVVYDQQDKIVETKMSQELYFLLTISTFITALRPMNKVFQTQQKFSKQFGQTDDYHIGAVPDHVYGSWIQLIATVSTLQKQKQLDENDVSMLYTDWQSFWEKYRERASLLIVIAKRKYTRKDKKNAFANLNHCILYEASIVAQLFSIPQLKVQADPLDFEQWIYHHCKHAAANHRETMISTSADRQSHQIMYIFLGIMVGIVTPFFLYHTYKSGFAYLYFLFLFYVIYFALYYTNKYRLKMNIYLRMADIWSTENSEENQPLFYSEAISVNMTSAAFLVTFCGLVMFGYQLYIVGWDGFAKFYLVLTIILLAFSIWFPYSPFVEKIITFYPKKVRVGHREFPIEHIIKISYDKSKICYHFYLTYTKEPYEIRIENDHQVETRKFFEQWCEMNQLDLTPFNKRDRDLYG